MRGICREAGQPEAGMYTGRVVEEMLGLRDQVYPWLEPASPLPRLLCPAAENQTARVSQ